MDKVKYSQKNALIIFMKVPRLSEVKTRLQPELSFEDSLNLYKAMGEDLLNKLAQSDNYTIYIHYWPADGLVDIENWLSKKFNYKAQQGLDLGRKLQHSFLEALNDFQKVCIIGSDLPTLQEEDILEAFEKLERVDVVLGPSVDGGYYLIALKELYSQIFQEIDWSTEFVLRQTLEKIEQQKLTVDQLPLKEDIDSYNDVLSLWNNVLAGNNNLIENIPRTFTVLKKIFTEYNPDS